MSEFAESIDINASRAAVWAELADIGAISEWNPGVRSSWQTTSGDVSNGSCRRCELGGKNYLDEEVVLFEPSAGITFRITDTNMPFETADIRFSLSGDGEITHVVVSPKYTLKFGALGRLLDAIVIGPVYRKGMRDLLRGLKHHVEAAAP